ncbi:ornithine cyclodeaminase [Actinoplanes sp. SE50]|uniref:2,3-diaminopropionate biosynthesis protein SbnB n=1 Tax=unclassified Actinoplanes TaxID=2626549 RepID=UPI00023ED60C|nr:MULTISPECIES: 2,3-diaminopropionate biosynthesis protein SbnB [unclassified Actinoplanes]AEV85016.1 ornithine cyclodeaminase [Actinoplanes sp. SE50/110]ATO83407.1 ornithine cyclodeaminase [Actinoplanes sp. SE50]SLM00814.1 2,3-diaminopropionate biosynthesis protein SbnB [Actinoplanes sp. SE50/110]
MLILGRADVQRILEDADEEVLRAVRAAYLRHEEGRTAVPHSVFLRFPDDDRNRIIALPAYLGGDDPVAGVKWIASFPANIGAGLPRATAVMILNSMRTGAPEAVLAAETISARRTAASAALAAGTLAPDTPGVTLIGCGVINAAVLRFLRTTLPELSTVTVFDLDDGRARSFADRITGLKVEVAPSIEAALGAHRLVSLATTAARPHLDTDHCRPGAVLLHLSLRDLPVPAVLASSNIVDDADHVCRASTSLHLAEQETGHRDFISGSLGSLLAGTPYRRPADRLTVFSPFGLGILDLAVARLVLRRATERGAGVEFAGF